MPLCGEVAMIAPGGFTSYLHSARRLLFLFLFLFPAPSQADRHRHVPRQAGS
jgi:hypothetical protein